MTNFTRYIVWIILGFALTACGQATDPKNLANETLDNLGCGDSQSKFYDSLYRLAENGEHLPSANALESSLLASAEERGMGGEKMEKFVSEFIRQYRVIELSTRANTSSADPQELVRALVALETGDDSTEELATTRDALQALKNQVSTAKEEVGASCPTKPETRQGNPGSRPTMPVPAPSPGPAPVPNDSLFDQIKKQLPPEVYGARKSLTTAYQSCEALSLRPMNASDQNVDGIKITGEHSSGGLKREISSLSAVRRTHYYLNQVAQQDGAGCHKIMDSPLIYDFGGKPFASANNNRVLDFFTNHGSGTKVLGIDCSGYIFSALAAGGLKLDPDVEMKAIHVTNIPARRYMNPEQGMRCFDHVQMKPDQGLKAGDIAASTGHIIMVDQVGSDPFALAGIQSAADCTTENMNSDKFNFVISQSSPSKGGIGINRMQARDYFKDTQTYREGFIQFAVAACKAKFGVPTTPKVSALALVRHKKTAACTTTPFSLQKESCLYLCPAI